MTAPQPRVWGLIAQVTLVVGVVFVLLMPNAGAVAPAFKVVYRPSYASSGFRDYYGPAASNAYTYCAASNVHQQGFFNVTSGKWIGNISADARYCGLTSSWATASVFNGLILRMTLPRSSGYNWTLTWSRPFWFNLTAHNNGSAPGNVTAAYYINVVTFIANTSSAGWASKTFDENISRTIHSGNVTGRLALGTEGPFGAYLKVSNVSGPYQIWSYITAEVVTSVSAAGARSGAYAYATLSAGSGELLKKVTLT